MHLTKIKNVVFKKKSNANHGKREQGFSSYFPLGMKCGDHRKYF